MSDVIQDYIFDPELESGFYKLEEGGGISYAPNFIQWPDQLLIQRSEKDTYDYPVRGYYWFETKAEAYASLEYVEPVDEIDPNATLAVFGSNSPVYEDMYVDPFTENTTFSDDVDYGPDPNSKGVTWQEGIPPKLYNPAA